MKYLIIIGALIILGSFYFTPDKETNYQILLRDCNVYEGACGLNDTIEVESMNLGNETVNKLDINEEFLINNCINLKEKTWACGKYLVSDLSL